MVSAIASQTAAPIPLSTRAAAAADLLAGNQAQPPAEPAAQLADPGADLSVKLPLYNSIEFVYRQDYGRIVLLEQQPDTGQEVTQVPSNYRLQQYAATVRAQRRSQMEKLFASNQDQPQQKQPASAGGTAAARPAAPAPSAPAPQAAPAPQLSAAPAAHLDIKV
jgi:hypothetical protein